MWKQLGRLVLFSSDVCFLKSHDDCYFCDTNLTEECLNLVNADCMDVLLILCETTHSYLLKMFTDLFLKNVSKSPQVKFYPCVCLIVYEWEKYHHCAIIFFGLMTPCDTHCIMFAFSWSCSVEKKKNMILLLFLAEIAFKYILMCLKAS